MHLLQVTPGAGGMYCGNCLRDNALVSAFRRQGHLATMVPLYLPLTLDETNNSEGTPIFFGGLNVYLDQKAALFRSAPAWLRRWLAHPALLKWTGRFAARTRASDVADLTLSMLRGEEGNQARDLDEFIGWARTLPPVDAVCISNALLLGMAPRLRRDLGARIVCLLAGEDAYLDAMAEPLRSEIWRTLSERALVVDAFVAPSRYFADRMADRMRVPAERMHVLPLGLNLAGFPPPGSPGSAATRGSPPAIGYLARMCREKGLDTLVEAYLELRRRNRVPGLRLKIAGGCGPGDEPFVAELRSRLSAAGVLGDVEFHPNLSREAKIAFLQSLTVFSVPALYGEAFGLYLLEALAAGVPVVQPRHAGFPEAVEGTGGGVLCEPGSATALADALESLLLDPVRCRHLGETGQRAVHERFSVDQVARDLARLIESIPPPR
ncbi:MAG: glycosyltransferase family 4 protein [Verrucomicrobia bacterium]|nr:glycosyltransferase family 4 protein [Verrucomicrobiota bacterium]